MTWNQCTATPSLAPPSNACQLHDHLSQAAITLCKATGHKRRAVLATVGLYAMQQRVRTVLAPNELLPPPVDAYCAFCRAIQARTASSSP